jgi:hypothetical protein
MKKIGLRDVLIQALVRHYGDTIIPSILGNNITSPKTSLSRGFMTQFPTHSYFGNNAEEFHPHETISTPIILRNFHHLSLNYAVSCQRI